MPSQPKKREEWGKLNVYRRSTRRELGGRRRKDRKEVKIQENGRE